MSERKVVMLILLSLVALIFVGCIENPTVDAEITTNAESVEDYNIATANNAFAFDMYSMIRNNDENVFFSPHSIFTAMAMCYDGAEDSTKEEIANVFYFPLNKTILEVSLGGMIDTINSETNDYELETANALWINNDFTLKEQYVSNVDNYYSGKVQELDFGGQPEESTNTINNWVEEKTNEKIQNLVSRDSINEDTRMIITNAIYFNGKWEDEFERSNTDERLFYMSDDDEITVETMFTQSYLNYGEDSDAKILELPYKGHNMCMYVVLPDDHAIEEFEKSFSVGDYEKLKSNMDSEYEVRVWIPKFKFETKTELSDQLSGMGMENAFISGNFSGISEEQLKISKVVHQAYVDVQEEGTEASAATSIEMAPTAAPGGSDPIIRTFRADHPFMIFIEDKRTGCILFMGKVGNPEY